MATISLRDFIGELQIIPDVGHCYLNKITGEFTIFSDDELAMAEREDEWDDYPDWQQVVFQKTKEVLSSDGFLELPSQFDIHEYEIMKRFCLSIENSEIRHLLLGKIQNSGAFRRFKNSIYQYEIEKDWFNFKDQAYKEIAISWLKNHKIAYIDDMK